MSGGEPTDRGTPSAEPSAGATDLAPGEGSAQADDRWRAEERRRDAYRVG